MLCKNTNNDNTNNAATATATATLNPTTARALVKNPKAWGPGSLKILFLDANLHHNRTRVPQILRAFLVMYCMHLHKLERAEMR